MSEEKRFSKLMMEQILEIVDKDFAYDIWINTPLPDLSYKTPHEVMCLADRLEAILFRLRSGVPT
jgi:hypothetical protein